MKGAQHRGSLVAEVTEQLEDLICDVLCWVSGEGGTGRLPPSETRLESATPGTASSPASARATRVGVGLENGMGMPNNDG